MEKNEKATSILSIDYKDDLEKHSTISEKDTKPAAHVYSPDEKKLLKKINWVFMPFVCVALFIQVKFK